MKIKYVIIAIILGAVAAVTTALFHLTQQPKIAYAIGHRLLEKGEIVRALPLLKASYQADPSNIHYIKDYARACQWNGQDRDALVLWQEAIYRKPNDPGVLESLADAYAREREYAPAIGIYQRLLRSHPTSMGIKKLAELLIWDGQFSRARELLAAEQRRSPNDLRLQLLWGQMLHYSGDYQQAIQVYQELLMKIK